MLAIDIRGLTKTYGTITALDDLDLSVESGGQIIGLLGPNGAGKTTLVEILEGLRTPTSGRVSVLGLDPGAARGRLSTKLGVQLQSTAFMPDLTARETLALYAALYPSARRPDDVLAEVSLAEKANALVRTLSGGQQQRLALAIATIHDPDLYFLDEPTAGLDPEARRQIHDVLVQLEARGKTIVLSSHYLDEIEALARRVIVLAEGRVVADGTPLELLARADGTSTLWVEAADPGDLATLVPSATFEGWNGALARYRTTDPTGAIAGLGATLRARGARLLDIRLKRPSLEDVYLQLVGAAPGRSTAPLEAHHVHA
jgi:ABC-2 type transport system ATP-binding protein